MSRKIHVKSLGKASTILNVPRTNMGFPAIILSFVGIPEGTCLIATGQKTTSQIVGRHGLGNGQPVTFLNDLIKNTCWTCVWQRRRMQMISEDAGWYSWKMWYFWTTTGQISGLILKKNAGRPLFGDDFLRQSFLISLVAWKQKCTLKFEMNIKTDGVEEVPPTRTLLFFGGLIVYLIC